ncbi:unnamed protein product [Caenorhabditis nigoni]
MIATEVRETYIEFRITARKYPELQENGNYEFIFVKITDSQIKLDRGRGIEEWRKEVFTQGDWIAHFLSIFNESMLYSLMIGGNVSLFRLDQVKEIYPKCKKLVITEHCSLEFIKIAFLKLFPIAEEVEIRKDMFENENDVSKFLTLNLKSVCFDYWPNPWKLKLDDLLTLNVTNLTGKAAIFTEKEWNRFLKLWMKGSHTFYRPKFIKLTSRRGMRVNREEVFKGIKYQIVDHKHRLRRADGKELLISCRWGAMTFEFQ